MEYQKSFDIKLIHLQWPTFSFKNTRTGARLMQSVIIDTNYQCLISQKFAFLRDKNLRINKTYLGKLQGQRDKLRTCVVFHDIY